MGGDSARHGMARLGGHFELRKHTARYARLIHPPPLSPTFQETSVLDVGNHLPLRGRRLDLHAEDDVADLALRQGRDVDVVLLAVVRHDEVLGGERGTHRGRGTPR